MVPGEKFLARVGRYRAAGRGSERKTFKDVVKAIDELPSPDAKPEYIDITATLMSIDPTQNMYYSACPDNNRKVIASSY